MRLRRFDRTDDVHSLGVVGHEEKVTIANEFVQADGHSQTVLEKVARTQFSVFVRAIPIVPFILGDADIFAGKRGDGFAVSTVRFGDPADFGCDLVGVYNDILSVLAIQVLADQTHMLSACREHLYAPASPGADRDGLERRVHFTHRVHHAVVLFDILFERHMPQLPVSIHLVADGPPFDAPGLRMAVSGATFAHRCVSPAVSIFNLLGGRLGSPQTGIDGNEGLRVDLTAQIHKLVKSHVVMFDALPGRILAGRPAVGIANTVFPVVTADKVPTWPTVDRRVELLQEGYRIGSPAEYVICRHERDRAD